MLPRVASVSNTTTASMDEWRLQGAALRHQAEQYAAMRGGSTIVRPTLKPKGSVAYALMGMALLHTALAKSSDTTASDATLTPNPYRALNAACWPARAGNHVTGFTHLAATMTHFFHAVTDSLRTSLSYLDRQLRFPAASAATTTLLPNDQEQAEAVFHPDMRHADNLHFPTDLEDDELSWRNEVIGRFLAIKGYQHLNAEHEFSAAEVVVAAIDFIQTRKYGERLLAMRLRRHAGLYGGWENEPTSGASNQEINRQWFNDNIFGGPLEQFVIDKASNGKMSRHWNTKLLYQTVLGIFNQFFIYDDIDVKTAGAIDWAWQNIVLQQLPVLQYAKSHKMMALPLTHFSWGQIHAGLLWSQYIALDIKTITEDEASALGSFLIAGMKKGALSSSWMRLFSLPAEMQFLDQDIDNEDILSDYFNERERYLNSIYPIETLALLMQNYKKRSEFNYDTQAFVEQNNAIAACYAKVDNVILSVALSSLPKSEYDFLLRAEMRKIDATFSCVKSWYYFGMMPEEAAAMTKVHKINLPVTVDLILADNGVEERFYALWQHHGKVQCQRMQNDNDYYAIFDDKRPQSDSGYRLEIHRGGRNIKERYETLHIAIRHLAAIHEETINKKLRAYGHDRNTGEIVRDVLLSLIPFYTCINESRQGNVELAVQACMMDVMSLAIPSTQLALMAARMSELLGVEAILAVNYFLSCQAMQVSIKNAALQGAQHFLYHGAYAVTKTLGWQHLAMLARAVDPGFELCYLIGRMGVKQAVRLGNLIVNITPGLEKTLSKLTDEIVMALPNAFSFNGVNRVGHGGKHPIGRIGFDALSAQDIYVAFSAITGEAYGHKYYRLADGSFRMVPHNIKHEFINLNLLHQGLGGGGAPLQGQVWAAEEGRSASALGVTTALPLVTSLETLRPISTHLLIELTQMSFDEFILQGGLEGVARDNHVDITALRRYLDEAHRLTPLGQRTLDLAQAAPSGPGPRRGSVGRVQNGYRHRYLLSLWSEMTESERANIGGIKGFAAQNRVDPIRLQRYLRKNGEFNSSGNVLMASGAFDISEAKTLNVLPRRLVRKKTEYRGELHRELLLRWSAMTHEERHSEGGIQGFAMKHNADPEQLRTYLKANGELNRSARLLLSRTAPGGKRSHTSQVSAQPTGNRGKYNGDNHRRILMMWHGMSLRQRAEEGGLRAFVTKHGADPQRLKSYLTQDNELNNAGIRLINRSAKGAKRAKTDALESAAASADAHASEALGEAVLASDRGDGHAVDEAAGGADAVVTIKDEPLDAAPASPRHQIDDDLPVLQSPDDNRISVLTQSEGRIDDLRVTHWGELHDAFLTLPKARIPAVKQQILADAQAWLRSQGEHRLRFEQTIYAAYDLAEGPERGMSIFARRPIAQFEVIGPYSGVLHASVASLHAEMARVGAVNVNTYLWGTRSSQRALSAFGHGNTLSLVNTGHLPGYPQWRANNLSAIRVGKNLIFYVAMRDIHANEELLVDYGTSFNPTGAE